MLKTWYRRCTSEVANTLIRINDTSAVTALPRRLASFGALLSFYAPSPTATVLGLGATRRHL